MHIVGISGPIGSGKTTFAELLVAADPSRSTHFESSTVVMELCNEFNAALRLEPLPYDAVKSTNNLLPALLPTLSAYRGQNVQLDEVAIHPDDIEKNPIWYNKLFDYFQEIAENPSLLTQTITVQNKPSYRALMQWVGGYFLYRLNDPEIWYRELKNRIAKLDNSVQFVALTAPRQPAEADYVHQALDGLIIMMQRPHVVTDRGEGTERSVIDIIPDITIINNGSLDDLQRTAVTVLKDIRSGKYLSSYTTAG